MTIVFSIPGEPFGWARARASAASGFVRMHQPAKNNQWRALVIASASAAWGNPVLLVPCSVYITAAWSRPKGHFTKKGLRPNAPVWRPSKPDVDNLAKGILDSLNGIVWHDDAQVVQIVVSKRWCRATEAAGVTVTIETHEEAAK